MVLLVSPNLPYAASFAKEGSEITNLLLQHLKQHDIKTTTFQARLQTKEKRNICSKNDTLETPYYRWHD